MGEKMMNKALMTINLQETLSLGETLAKSGYFSDAKGAAQAVVKILAGAELGFGPIASMTGVHIVQGKPTLGANLMGAAIKRTGKYNYRVVTLNEQQCEIAFYEDGEEVGRSAFAMADAQRAGLANKDNWKKYPRNMLFSRCLSNGARWYCPDVFSGVTPYTPEELGAEVDGESGVIIEGQFTATEPEEKNKHQATQRPLSAEAVQGFLHRKADQANDGQLPATEKQSQYLARKFQEAFAPDNDAQKRYHISLDWLWSVDSAKKLTMAQAGATLDWLLAKGGPDKTGDTPLHEHARAEVATVYREALKAQGQQEMQLEETEDDNTKEPT